MKTSITSDISRLELHDSSFEMIIRHNQELELVFDWTKLENFIENNIIEPIIIGRTKMRLTGVNVEEFKVYFDEEKFTVIPFPEAFSKNLISSNEINDADKTIKINALFRENKDEMYDWVEWRFNYDTCEISWTSYVTKSEWLNGKLPTY